MIFWKLALIPFCLIAVISAFDSSAAQTSQSQTTVAKRAHSPTEFPALVRAQGQESRLQGVFLKLLGLGDSDIRVHRLGLLNESTNIFRAIDVLPETTDFVMLIREGDHLTLWRVSKSGRVLVTAEAAKGGLARRVDNARYDKEFRDMTVYFYECLDLKPGQKCGKD